ncbi:MAG: hypothetical protein AB7P67_13270 [Vicinamibacterales bacterium]
MGIVLSVGCGGAPEGAAGEGAPDAAPGAGAEAAAPAPAPPVQVTVPAGTALSIALTSTVSTETAKDGDAVEGTVAKDVSVDGRVAIPAGAVVTGAVTEAVRPGRVKGRAQLAIRFTSVTLGGDRQTLATSAVVRTGEATKSEDATKVGIGAGAGAVVGAILGGGKGAAKGAAVGAAGGTGVVLATRGEDVAIAKGAPVSTTLTAPITVTLAGR